MAYHMGPHWRNVWVPECRSTCQVGCVELIELALPWPLSQDCRPQQPKVVAVGLNYKYCVNQSICREVTFSR